MKIAIGNDHAATNMKFIIMEYVQKLGHEMINFGTDELTSSDYPVYAKLVGEAVISKKADCGILICGSGIGISIAANKIKGIRCGVCSDTVSARLMKEHNNANIIAFGARIVGEELARDMIKAYLEAVYMEDRHKKRVTMIHELEVI